jgi:hypothetical protein
MSEQRPRLLPFRLRRREARRGLTQLFRADDTPADTELRRLLAAWQAPPPDPSGGARLLAAYRAHTAPAPLWRRLLTARLSLPAPLAAGAVGALVVAALALFTLASRGAQSPAAAAARAASAVRFVEVPVPQEKVVTRYVYVEREPRAPAPAPAARPGAPAPDASDASDASGAAETAETTSYFTGVDMAEFRPASKMEIRVIKRGRPEEEPEKPEAAPEKKTR